MEKKRKPMGPKSQERNVLNTKWRVQSLIFDLIWKIFAWGNPDKKKDCLAYESTKSSDELQL